MLSSRHSPAEKWRSRQESHLQPPGSKPGTLIVELRERIGAAPRIRTGTGRGLSAVPLRWASAAKNGCPGWIRASTTPVRAEQAAVTSRGKKVAPLPGVPPGSRA